MIWQGELLHIHVASKGSAAMDERPEALLVPRVGIDGDRYARAWDVLDETAQ